MCGIFAYFGPREDAPELVLKGLKKLEYRGYDSWGIAAMQANGHIEVEKHVGKISEVKSLKATLQEPSHLALGHSRWATHGGVTDPNAHPHSNGSGSIVIVHNGIFENYVEVKEQLKKEGYEFRSETDSEVFAHLIDQKIKAGADFETGFKQAIGELEGRYAVLALNEGENKLLAARRGSPLIVGKGEDGTFFVASDVPAFLEYSRQVMYLDDEQMVAIDSEGARFYDLETNTLIQKRVIAINWQLEEAEKGDYAHFMIKEIMEQKETLARAIDLEPQLLNQIAELIQNAYGTYLIGCGTAGKVAMCGEYLFAQIAHKHVNVKFGSEFHMAENFLTDRSLVIAISQSGETADTLEAIEIARKKGAKIVSIVNVETSTMARASDFVLPLKAGPEKAVASTKATTSQLAVLTLLAYATAGKLNEGRQMLVQAAGQINDMLNPRYEELIQELAHEIHEATDIMIIGREAYYPMALETAIKIQEISYIHAEGFAGGELKHGPIALISEGVPCIVLAPTEERKSEILSNAMEIKSRGGFIIGISPENSDVFDRWIRIPDLGPAAPIVSIIPIQILAYHLALARKNDPDMPRNLAKSVTVK